ncbi:MAG: hypothetical protein SVY53_12865 [Chloroflexota bacterium]|nr:hypothetical protein [Chloroflexota bacterium]
MGDRSSEIVIGVPTIEDGEITKYHLMGQDSKVVSGYITQKVNKVRDGDKECYSIYTKTEYVEGGLIEETSVVQIEEGPRPVSTDRVVKSRTGTILLDAKQIFRDDSLAVPCNPTLPGVDGLSFCLRGCRFEPKKKIEITAMCLEGTSLSMHGSVSKDKVTVPAGTFTCYKVELVARLTDTMGVKAPPGMGGIIDHFMPTILHWYTEQEPHYLVKFEGMPLSSSATVRRQSVEGEQAVQELLSIGE